MSLESINGVPIKVTRVLPNGSVIYWVRIFFEIIGDRLNVYRITVSKISIESVGFLNNKELNVLSYHNQVYNCCNPP